MKATIGSVTTLYPGTHFEYVNSTTYTRYYFAGADLVAFERSSGYGSGAGYGRRFVLRDHPSATLRTSLGSTSVIVNGQGNVIGQDLYQPYGDVRYQWRSGTTTLQTTYRYTSQRMEVGVAAPSPVSGLDRGLYFYGARWGACPEWNEGTPSLVRFIQPDTIVPNPGDSSSLNRYTYTANNPMRYVDPSGHAICASDDCVVRVHPQTGQPIGMQQKWGIVMTGSWESDNAWMVYEGMRAISQRVGEHLAKSYVVLSGDEWVRKNVEDTNFERWPNDKPFIHDDGTNRIEFSIHPAITLFRRCTKESILGQQDSPRPVGRLIPDLDNPFLRRHG